MSAPCARTAVCRSWPRPRGWATDEGAVNLQRAKRGQIIEIEWIDSCSNAGWQSEKEVLKWGERDPKASHYSVGFVLAVNEQVIVLVQSFADFSDDYRSVN